MAWSPVGKQMLTFSLLSTGSGSSACGLHPHAAAINQHIQHK
jgi:hypothetical protein